MAITGTEKQIALATSVLDRVLPALDALAAHYKTLASGVEDFSEIPSDLPFNERTAMEADDILAGHRVDAEMIAEVRSLLASETDAGYVLNICLNYAPRNGEVQTGALAARIGRMGHEKSIHRRLARAHGVRR